MDGFLVFDGVCRLTGGSKPAAELLTGGVVAAEQAAACAAVSCVNNGNGRFGDTPGGRILL